MNRLRTSWTLFTHALVIMGRHRKLILFPLLNVLGGVGIIAFFAIPIIFHATALEFLQDFGGVFSRWGGEMVDSQGEAQIPFWQSAVLYFACMILVTYINVAFFHEILEAFNDRPVSIGRGLAFASTRFRAILYWSLLAGIVGSIIRQVEENVGFVGRWFVGLIGITWSVASVFAIPVIIREQRQDNPVTLLKTSGNLIKRTWGEGLIGVVGFRVLSVLMVLGLLIGGVILMFVLQNPLILALAFLAVFVFLYLMHVVRNIFYCGLYVFATEGVAPGAFDEALFDNPWRVKKTPDDWGD